MEIIINVIGQKLKLETYLKNYIAGSQRFIKFIFNLNDEWNDLTTFAQFIQGGNAYNVYLSTINGIANCIYLPHEITPGECKLLLYGTGGDTIATTNYLSLTIDKNMFVSDANSTEISRSLYDQLIKRFNQAIVGKAFVANALTDMIDTSMIYVYVGETTSTLTYGDWYYHNGSAWVSGGAYMSQSYIIGDNLTLENNTLSANFDAISPYMMDLTDAVNNAYDILRLAGRRANYTYQNKLHFDYDKNAKAWLIYGTVPKDGGIRNLIDSPDTIPPAFEIGRPYRVFVDCRDKDGNDIGNDVYLRVTRLKPLQEGQSERETSNRYFYRGEGTIVIPSDYNGIAISIIVSSRVTEIDGNITFKTFIKATNTNAELKSSVDALIQKDQELATAIDNIDRRTMPSAEAMEAGDDFLRLYGVRADAWYTPESKQVHFVYNSGDDTWTVTGTSPIGGATRSLIFFEDSLPYGMTPGKEYTVTTSSLYADGTSTVHVYARADFYKEGYRIDETHVDETKVEKIYLNTSSKQMTVPIDAIGVRIGLFVLGDTIITDENPVTFKIRMREYNTNKTLSQKTAQMSARDDGTHFSGEVFVGGNKPLFFPRRTLTEADDLDEVTEPGWYYATLNHIPKNAPSVHTTCYLVFSNSAQTVTAQIGFNKMEHMYFRAKLADTAGGYYGGSDFGSWKRLAEASEIPSGGDDEDTVSVGYNVDPGFIRGADGRDIPPNTGTMISYKRAHQMLDTRYTTLANTPSAVPPEDGGLVTIRSATEYVGIPYSSAKEYEMYVGTDISFRTFMTAIHNPYSLQYTECVRGGNYTYNGKTSNGYGISGYNLQYHGGDSCGPYYGGVCSQFVWTCLGMKNRWASQSFEYLTQQGILYIVPENSSGGTRLMDIVQERRSWDSTAKKWKPSHETVITDIYRNERGVPQYIYVSECTTNGVYVKDGIVVGTFSGSKPAGSTACVGCRTTRYTAAEFDAYLAESHGRLFRYLKISENLDYTPSEFVAVEDESAPGEYSYNDKVCTYAGDYAAFRLGFPVHINYVKGSYTQAVIKRGSATVATITLPTEYNETHSIDISSHCDTAGKYTVHLTDGTNNSEPTHFEVVDTTTTVSGAMATQNDILTVTFNKNARPMYVELSNIYGGQRGLRPLTEKEIKAGTVTFNAYDYIASTTGYNYPTGNCIRVKYRGDYGNVTSVLLPVETE